MLFFSILGINKGTAYTKEACYFQKFKFHVVSVRMLKRVLQRFGMTLKY